MDSIEWNEANIARLRELWLEGLPAAEIGRRMNITKNAVVGKARRTGLTGRPSPILPRRDPSSVQQPIARAPKTTLPAIAACAASMPDAAVPHQRNAGEAKPTVIKPRSCGKAAAPARPAVRRTCAFPLWGNVRPTQCFCEQAALPSKPYCSTHCAVCYVAPRGAPTAEGTPYPHDASEFVRETASSAT